MFGEYYVLEWDAPPVGSASDDSTWLIAAAAGGSAFALLALCVCASRLSSRAHMDAGGAGSSPTAWGEWGAGSTLSKADIERGERREAAHYSHTPSASVNEG